MFFFYVLRSKILKGYESVNAGLGSRGGIPG